ncbi:MAG: hypothetical protein KBT03_00155 [Bacteroidales bacterium]|nr:hypothetical protein [Candidatus Scybalousia scybalohippi]
MITLLKSNTTIDSIDMIENDNFIVEVTHFQELSNNFKLGVDYSVEVNVKGFNDLEFHNDSYGVVGSSFIGDNREDVFSFTYDVYDLDENVVDSYISDELKIEIEDKVMQELVDLKIEEIQTMEGW